MTYSRVPESAFELGPPISRHIVLARASSWLSPPVPYSQIAFHTNEYGCYRTDCSGYVSMAWALPGKPPSRHGGLDTRGLSAVSVRIAKDMLAAGDILLRTDGTNHTRHVAIFAGWADLARATYWGFEQAGSTGTTHRLIAYPYGNDAELYRPYRYLNLT